ncbi:unnamed protein product [Ceratitis capitata]|uniref:(Mediterranean fruit fly) hypothetical protein n=1 Tax=Ceratitis capitata TaxID=7213 RepID=A0A811V294_CERCA|nr:unnamed protein product [Ceratitis capitata]
MQFKRNSSKATNYNNNNNAESTEEKQYRIGIGSPSQKTAAERGNTAEGDTSVGAGLKTAGIV